jgi:hypothetical protein
MLDRGTDAAGLAISATGATGAVALLGDGGGARSRQPTLASSATTLQRYGGNDFVKAPNDMAEDV